MISKQSVSIRPGTRRLLPLVIASAFAVGAGTPAWAFKMGIHDDITRQVLSEKGFDEDSADEAADSSYYTDLAEAHVSAAHVDNGQLGAGSQRLKAKRDAVVEALRSCKRRDALDDLGAALHTVQDVFAHSNAVDNGIAVDPMSMSDVPFPTSAPIPATSPYFCNASGGFAPGALVSGYFSAAGWALPVVDQCMSMQPGWCCHLTLNKDDGSVPNGARFPAAKASATDWTGKYLMLVEQQIKDTVGDPQQAEYLTNMLKKKQRKEYFVIDDTGSMGGDIAGVKSAVHGLVDAIVAAGEAPTLGLVSFKDSPSLRGEFCDLEDFRAQVDSLSASGGGDCPEASNSALLTALYQFPTYGGDMRLTGGRIHLATDASAGDASLGPAVVGEAHARGVAIDAILTGDCVAETAMRSGSAPAASQNDPAAPPAAMRTVERVAASASDPLTSPSARTQLRAITQATGGVLFQVTRAEVASIVPTLLEMGDPQSVTLLSRRLSLAGGADLEVPVDDTLGNVTFMVSLTRAGTLPAVTITRPNGTVVAAGDADVRQLSVSSVVGYTIAAPEPGLWRISLSGTGDYATRVYGSSPLHLNQLRFVDLDAPRPRPEVEFMPLDGQPVVGDLVTADLRFTQGPDIDRVVLRTPDGRILADLVPETADQRYFRVRFTAPAEAFLIQAMGTSPAGKALVREVTVPVSPQPVGLRVVPADAETVAGETVRLEVGIRNASASRASYRLRVTSEQGWTIELPADVPVDAGTSATVQISVTPPTTAVAGTRDRLLIMVEDTANTDVRNSSHATLTVIANRPPVCAGATASPAVIWPPKPLTMVPVTIGGVTDPDGDPLSLVVTGITQDEPVTWLGCGIRRPDAEGVGTANPRVRGERGILSDGRVYEISFTATDPRGAQCLGKVQVGVPKNHWMPAKDSGQKYDSTKNVPPFSWPKCP